MAVAAREQEIAEEYASSLSDLNFNSKPLINMLTMLADEYRDHARVIVSTVEQHLLKVRTEVKLPALYLIDSIVKNVGVRYTQLFKQNIASLFCGVFEKVDEKIRANMFKLRCTWTGVFPDDCLQQLDMGVNKIDRAWPIVSTATAPAVTATPPVDSSIKETLLKKQKELLELQHKRLELELLQTKARLQEQQRQLEQQNAQAKQETVKDVKTALPQLKGDVAKLLASPNPDPEQAKKLKNKLAQLSAIASNQHTAASAISENSGDSKTKISTGKAKQTKPTPAVTASPPVSKPAAPFVNPFVKHNTPSSVPSDVTSSIPPRVSINPVSSDLVTAVAVRRTASAAAVRDPRLRRNEPTTTSPAPVTTTFTVTISEPPVSDKKRHRERNSSSTNDELFGDSYQKKSSRSSSKSLLDDKRDRKSDRSDKDAKSVSKKSSKHVSDSEKRSQDSDMTRSPRHQSRKTPEKTVSKPKADESRGKSSENLSSPTIDIKKKEKQLEKPLLKPHQLPPIPKLKDKKAPTETLLPTESKPKLSNSRLSEEVSNKPADQSRSPNKLKDSIDDKISAERRKTSSSKVQKSSEQLSSLEETIRLKKKQIEDELKANAKNLHELHEKINEKEKYNDKEMYNDKDKSDKVSGRNSDKDNLEEDEGRNNSSDSTTEDVANLDDIIRLRKPETSSQTMDVEHDETDFEDIIRMRNLDKRKDKERANLLKSKDETVKESLPALEDVSDSLKEKPVDTHLDKENDVNNTPVLLEEPPRPRLFIKNIALLTKPPTPPSQDLDEISEDELMAENTIPITGLLEDDSDEEPMSDSGELSTPNSAGKFKELKASSLKRLRQFVRSRDQLTPSPPPPPSVKELTAGHSSSDSSQQNDLAQITTGDVDLRPLLMPNSSEEPPPKKSKPESALDLFGFGLQDVDLRNPQPSSTGRPKIPSPPPPPIISTGKEEAAIQDQTSGGGKAEKRKIRVKPYSQLERSFDISPDDSRKNYDTDMRHIATPTRNVKAIVKQAEIDLKNGSISFADYSNILRRLSSQQSEQSTPKTSESEQPTSLSPSLTKQMSPPPLPPLGLQSPPSSNQVPPPPLPPMGLLDDDNPPQNALLPNLTSIPTTQSIQPVPMSTPMPMLPQPPPGLLAHPMLPQMPPLLPFPGHLVRPGPPGPFPPMPPLLAGLPVPAPGMPFIPRPPAKFSSFGGLQPADPEVLASIMRDQMKSINIDSVARPIRFYGHTGIVFLAWDDPREIGFVKGVRKITFDGTETVICQLNAPYKDFALNGVKHRIRLGNPTRELYIDDDFYECCFGGPPLCVDIGGQKHLVTLEGPPPTVTIDTKKRMDLCAGKVDLYIDDTIHVPMFLDCKPHKVDVDGYPYILRFVEALRLLVINGSPFKINFGGTPVTIALHDKNHSFAFSPLPPGVRQGYVHIAHMDGGRLPSPPPLKPSPAVISAPPMLEEDSQESGGAVALGKSDEGIPFLNSGEINVTDLFAKLVALGALPATQPAEDTTRLKPVSWHSPAMSSRQPAMIHSLYSGIQCGSCGARFPPDHTAKYSLHLDWHFRLNRRERDLGRSVQSRKFYFSSREWTAYYEIEDDDNKGQSWFEMQEASGEGRGMAGAEDSSASEELLSSCTAELNEVEPRCFVCRDRFEQFYNEEKEEWQLRRALRVEGIAYHPVCYRDFLASREAKENEEVPDDSFVDPEEGPVPEDAAEFTRQIPVGVYTIADDNEDDREVSVVVIEQDKPDDALLKMETDSDLNAVTKVKTELLDQSSKLIASAENSNLPAISEEGSSPSPQLEDSNKPTVPLEDTSHTPDPLEDNIKPTVVLEDNKATIPLEDNNKSTISLEDNNKSTISLEDNNKATVTLEDNNKPIVPLEDNNKPVVPPEDSNELTVPMEDTSDPANPLDDSSVPSPKHEEGASNVHSEVLVAVKEEPMQVEESQSDVRLSNLEEHPTETTEVSEKPVDTEVLSDKAEEALVQVNETIAETNDNCKQEEIMETKVKEEIEDVLENVTDLDGNMRDKANVPNTLPAPKRIRINITKTVLPGNIVKPIEPTIFSEKSLSPKPVEVLDDTKDKENGEVSDLKQPKTVKPLIASKKMTVYPPLNKGKDLSALCSIM